MWCQIMVHFLCHPVPDLMSGVVSSRQSFMWQSAKPSQTNGFMEIHQLL